jgi:hypothetical protein
MKRARIQGITLLGALILATSAAASNGKTREVVDRFASGYADSVDCSAFGPYDFDNEFGGTQKVSVTDVYGADGTLLQTVFHITLDETETNSVTGYSLPLRGNVHEVWDYASNTRTLTGIAFLGTVRGGGTYTQDTGRITITFDTRVTTFLAGPHEAFLAGGIDYTVCAALAG